MRSQRGGRTKRQRGRGGRKRNSGTPFPITLLPYSLLPLPLSLLPSLTPSLPYCLAPSSTCSAVTGVAAASKGPARVACPLVWAACPARLQKAINYPNQLITSSLSYRRPQSAAARWWGRAAGGLNERGKCRRIARVGCVGGSGWMGVRVGVVHKAIPWRLLHVPRSSLRGD
ncbi:hypothetical protein E2C01_077793 [Portunus trituberculatus]|uniref:Uncharacterized protein n=1 Tax=Portunus trituberculatus TaxID=210409 RepID=A0A5B7IGX6_PORTR|nr:hypothetical protein [Portunus trituberculatus]